MRAKFKVKADVRADVLKHHLALFGCSRTDLSRLTFLFGDRPWSSEVFQGALRHANDFVIVLPDAQTCAILGITPLEWHEGPVRFIVSEAGACKVRRVRSLGGIGTYSGGRVLASLESAGRAAQDRPAVWLSLSSGPKRFLVLGSDVVRDLVDYRQGNPEPAGVSEFGTFGGFAHERANRLYSDLRSGEPPRERHADCLADAIAGAVSATFEIRRSPMLPGDASGAVVVTGDDDQAYLERYEAQLRMLDGLPVTYFLHPLTRLDRKKMKEIFEGHNVELGLHPDSLDDPSRYAERLLEQSAWFRQLTGSSAISVRNHGFLSAGYWEYVPLWEDHGLHYSSNLTATDGTALNGSYLPGRMVLNGHLTDHWSILTTVGDGLLFAHKNSPTQAAEKIRSIGREIVGSKLPGVVVLNLHPQNVDRSSAMHRAVHDLVSQGFIAWTLGECIAWFQQRDST